MKKLLATLASIAMITVCSTAAFAADEVGGTTAPGECSGDLKGDGNVPTGVVLTVVPVALAAGALTVSGIVLKKKNK